MSRRHLIMLLGLAAIWGSSFMFIEIALRDLAPATVILLRIVTGALTLGGLHPPRRPPRSARSVPTPRPLAVLGVVNTALPFFLIAWGQQYIDSGLAAILNASAPLFTARLRPVARPEPAGHRPAARRRPARLRAASSCSSASSSAAASARSSAAWRSSPRPPATGIGGLYAGRRFNGLPPALVAFGTLVWATLFTLPLGAAQATMPGWESLLAVLYLGLAATGAAYLLYFGLIAGAGASKAVLVTYLVPALALVYGAVLLDEQVTALALAGSRSCSPGWRSAPAWRAEARRADRRRPPRRVGR